MSFSRSVIQTNSKQFNNRIKLPNFKLNFQIQFQFGIAELELVELDSNSNPRSVIKTNINSNNLATEKNCTQF